jgi:hypothetical protein
MLTIPDYGEITMSTDFKTFNNDKRSEFIAELGLDEHLTKELKLQQTSIEIVNHLISQNMQDAAINFIAMGLPKRQAAWWGLLAAKKIDAEKADVNTQNALKISEQWIRNPSEELRRQAKDLADVLDLYSPAAWLAISIFWSGDNIAPLGKTSVSPGEHMSAMGITACINSALETSSIDQRIALHKYFIKQGMHIAMGGNGQI